MTSTRLRGVGLVGILSGIVLSVAAATSTWHSGSAKGLDHVVGWNVGGIQATSGAYEAWSISGDVQTVGGKWGCTFQGSEPGHEVGHADDVTDYSYHLWAKDGGSPAAAHTLNVRCSVTPGSSGACGQLDPNYAEWWFRPSVTAIQQQPIIKFMNYDTGDWEVKAAPCFGRWDYGTSPPQQYMMEGYYQTPNIGDHPTAPTNGGHSGYSWRKIYLPNESHAEYARIEFPFEVDASLDVDNAKAEGWMEYLTGTLETFVDSSNPSDEPVWP